MREAYKEGVEVRPIDWKHKRLRPRTKLRHQILIPNPFPNHSLGQ